MVTVRTVREGCALSCLQALDEEVLPVTMCVVIFPYEAIAASALSLFYIRVSAIQDQGLP